MWKIPYQQVCIFLFISILLLRVALADEMAIQRLQFTEQLRASDAATGYAALINLASEPYVSSSTLRIKNDVDVDEDLTLTKFPFRYEFLRDNPTWTPFVLTTLSRLIYKQSYEILEDTYQVERVEPRYEAYSISLGGGANIKVSEHWSLMSALDIGYANLKNETSYSGSFGNSWLKPLASEILYDWSVDSWLANGHFAVLHKSIFQSLGIDLKLSYTLSHIQSYRASTEFQEFREDVGTVDFEMDASHPLGVTMLGYPLILIGHLGHSNFVGGNRDSLGFSYFNEAGMSLQADISRHHMVIKNLSLGGMGIWGDEVSGWSLILGYDF